jgi:ribosome maturation factor RimP
MIISLTFALTKDDRRERSRSLLLLSPPPDGRKIVAVNMEHSIEQIEQNINNLIKDDNSLFLIEVKIRPTNNIKVFIDGDQGVNIDKLVQYNRKLYKQIEESNMFPNGDFSLEVSSPGLDEPLKLHRQYLKNIGRYVEVMEKEGNKKEGKLLSLTDGAITLEEEKGHGKKREIVQHIISFDNIKTTKIQIKF